MSMLRGTRVRLCLTCWVLVGAGVASVAYGAWLLVTRQSAAHAMDTLLWLAGGVILHDLVLAPVVVALGWVAVPLLPICARAPAVVGGIVLGTLTLTVVPVLGGFGRRADNPTLLDRDYAAGWVAVAAAEVAAVVAASVLRSRHARTTKGEGPG
jgi:hypothetical protein